MTGSWDSAKWSPPNPVLTGRELSVHGAVPVWQCQGCSLTTASACVEVPLASLPASGTAPAQVSQKADAGFEKLAAPSEKGRGGWREGLRASDSLRTGVGFPTPKMGPTAGELVSPEQTTLRERAVCMNP